MQNQSVAIFTLGQSKPESVISELERIFNVEDSKGLIEFRPIPRLRGILAISKNAALLKRADSWVRRLDRDSPIAGQNVFVYKARNRSATELAKVLSGLFGGGSSTASATRSSNRSQRSAETNSIPAQEVQELMAVSPQPSTIRSRSRPRSDPRRTRATDLATMSRRVSSI